MNRRGSLTGGDEARTETVTSAVDPAWPEFERSDRLGDELANDDLIGLGDELVIDITSEPARIFFREIAVALDTSEPGRWVRFSTRAFDVVGSALMIVALLPIFALLWFAVRITSPGKAVYASTRIGRDGLPFPAYKFRSMVEDADQLLAAHLVAHPEARDEYQRSHKLSEDPRLTVIGSFIRKSSLDELPQLFNVLRGDMSLVGPRPKLPFEVERFGPTIDTVLRVKPGITGLWQVSGRSNLSFDERIVLDVTYATTRTLSSDVAICCRTVVQIFQPGKNGAY